MVHQSADWQTIPISIKDLCINTTLRCGQSFRWRKIEDTWHCALYGKVISLKQSDHELAYKSTLAQESQLDTVAPIVKLEESEEAFTLQNHHSTETIGLISHYFNLSHNLTELYTHWSALDKNFRLRAPKFTGIRILNQDAWEALICFICSSNNNIARIGQMVHKLCVHYGEYIATIDGEDFYDFPAPAALIGDTGKVEAHLRELGFGYRARYIADTARIVAHERHAGWLEGLRNPESPSWRRDKAVVAGTASDEAQPPASSSGNSETVPSYRAAHTALLSLSGVGPKVADCVCLFGLGWGEAVPVDTHVWNIAVRDYKFGKGGAAKSKTFSKAMYDAVGDHFRALWGDQAGWAHSVLFTADLRTFADRNVKVEVKGEVKAEEGVAATKEETPGEGLHMPRKKRKRVETLISPTTTEKVKVEVEGDSAIMTVAKTRGQRRKLLS